MIVLTGGTIYSSFPLYQCVKATVEYFYASFFSELQQKSISTKWRETTFVQRVVIKALAQARLQQTF